MSAIASKRALCVGIGDYPVPGRDLRGTVNDAKAWASLLNRSFDFAKADIALVLDEKATRSRILGELDALLAGTRADDVRVFMIACHGTYLADEDGDEADEYDEALCPWDYKDALIRDDELRERLAGTKRGARVTVITDCCYSGTVTRDPAPDPAGDRRLRFMPPDQLGRTVIADVRAKAHPRRKARTGAGAMKELLLSACRSDQYAYEDKFGRSHLGALSYHAIRLIEQAAGDISYANLAQALRRVLREAGYDQEPQLEASAAFKRRKVFT